MRTKLLFINCLLFLNFFPALQQIQAQELTQVVFGEVRDSDSHQPIPGANVVCESCHPVKGISTDTAGIFRLTVPLGRHTFSISHIAYTLVNLKDIQVTSGKSVMLNVDLHEQVIQTDDISIKGSYNRWINPMATVSVRSLRSQDAVRYASGYFDPSRMVANFAGVNCGSEDDNNEIIIRGNSPRGILWRLEGVEIPNPNHFANGQGSTSGGYTAITTDVLSSFDFFTGSFPAEYGNALSGVMDLSLRNGNPNQHEHSVMLSVLGTELTSEGPFRKNSGNTYLACFRYGDFSYLDWLHLLDQGEMNLIPKTKDWAFRTNFNLGSAGTLSLFTLGGISRVGDRADVTAITAGLPADNDEYTEDRRMTITGIKHVVNLPDNRTWIRSTLAYTWEHNSDEDAKVETTGSRTITYFDKYRYPALRFSALLNHKFNPRHSFRGGLNANYISGEMFAKRHLGKLQYDTLLNANTGGWYGGAWIQWKYKSSRWLETNTGLHLMISGITGEIVPEPRLGMIFRTSPKSSVTLGTGFHSRHEPLSIYNYRVKITKKLRDTRNSDLKTTKAFHLTSGFNYFIGENLHLNLEAYYQYLYDVPVNELAFGQFSILNQAEGLPDVRLDNKGKGKNYGLEFTIEKSFSGNYYFLGTASLFNSFYKAPDKKWYNTFYNTNFVYNIQAGKEFPFGKQKQQVPGIRMRANYRGGLRYTPVDEPYSLRYKKLVYQADRTYGERLPDFKRFDLGITWKINRPGFAVTFMCDIQNAGNTRNILRRRFSYENKAVVTRDFQSIGMVPVLAVKAEF